MSKPSATHLYGQSITLSTVFNSFLIQMEVDQVHTASTQISEINYLQG